MIHVWSVFCSRPIVDAESNQLSLIETIEAVTVFLPPGRNVDAMDNPSSAVEFRSHLVSLWERSDWAAPEIGQMRIRLFDPSGAETAPTQDPIAVDLSAKNRMRTIIGIAALPLRGVGRYEFRIEASEEDGRWTVAARIPFELKSQVVDSPAEETVSQSPKKKKKR
jgi:hypothetical protein